MPTRAVALLSGGLDSMLAIRILQEQGVEVEALNFKTAFTCCQETSAQAARELGVRHTVLAQEDDYLDLIRRPKYGYGRGANPCVDCRIYMFERAKRYMDEVGADCVVSGEVLGQRPMSQKRRDLMTIERESGLKGLLLRPLSARLLPKTQPERDGRIDRSRLYAFVGRSRKPLIELARQFGFRTIPQPSTGCALTERQFANKVHDLVQLDPGNTPWDFELLKVGRHFRYDSNTKVIVGRREAENELLERFFERDDVRASALLRPVSFLGPSALLCGPATESALWFTASLLVRYGKSEPDGASEVAVCYPDRQETLTLPADLELADVPTLGR